MRSWMFEWHGEMTPRAKRVPRPRLHNINDLSGNTYSKLAIIRKAINVVQFRQQLVEGLERWSNNFFGCFHRAISGVKPHILPWVSILLNDININVVAAQTRTATHDRAVVACWHFIPNAGARLTNVSLPMGVIATVTFQATSSLKKMAHLCLVDAFGVAQFVFTVGKHAMVEVLACTS